jgi:hypothetical protein
MRRPLRTLPVLVAACLAMTGVSLFGGVAQAYCRESTVGPPSNYDPTLLGCYGLAPDGGALTVATGPDGGLLTGSDGHLVTTAPDAGVTLFPLFWRNQCVSYSFEQAGAKHISATDASRIAAQAFAAWSNAPCPGGPPNIVADPYPAVDCENAQSHAHNNVIIFRDNGWPYDDGSNAIGYTTLTIGKKTGEIFGANIEINSFGFNIVADLPAATTDAGGAADGGAADAGLVLDLGSILTHEAGHFLGLAHSPDVTAVMYAHYHPGSTTLSADDIAGICAIYHSDGTRETGNGPVAETACHPDPPLGFLTSCGSLDSGIVGAGVVGSGGAGPNDSDGGADPPCPPPPNCSVGSARGTGNAGLGACGILALAALACRARRSSRRARVARRVRTAALPLSIFGALSSATLMHLGDAKATVSASVRFDQLLEESSAVAEATPIDTRSLWEGDRIVTYTRMRVERLVAGHVTGDVWVRTLGGEVGDLAQIVEGQATFPLDRPSLLFLRVHVDPVTGKPTESFVVVERAQGQFPVVTSAGKPLRLALAPDPGLLLPPAARAGAAQGGSAARDDRLARDVLNDRTLDDAVREIQMAWAKTHP